MSDFKSGIVRMRSRARSDATHSHEKHRNRTRSDASDGLQPLTSSDFSPLRSVREAFILPEEESLQLTRRGTRTTYSLSCRNAPPTPLVTHVSPAVCVVIISPLFGFVLSTILDSTINVSGIVVWRILLL